MRGERDMRGKGQGERGVTEVDERDKEEGREGRMRERHEKGGERQTIDGSERRK